MPQPRQMSLIAFMQAQNCSNYVGSWRHPSSMSDFTSPEYYQRIARTLEDAKFDLAFFDDRLAMPDIYGNDHRETVANGIRAVKLDPTIVLMTMAAATSRLGLGSTYSTTYYEPFHVARLFATLDLMTGGPGGLERGDVAQQFGGGEFRARGASRARPALRPRRRVHGGRHRPVGQLGRRRADRRQGDAGASPIRDKVRRLDHHGRYFQSKGPLTVPRSAQGHPVLLQAGQSGRGMAFAACWAELVFAAYPSLEAGRKQYAYLKSEVEKAGRDPALVKIAPAVKIIVAETAAQAEEQRALTAALAKPIDRLALLCEVLNVDFSKRRYDEPFSDQELASVSWQSLRDRVIAKTRQEEPLGARLRRGVGPRLAVRRPGVLRHAMRRSPTRCRSGSRRACDGFVAVGDQDTGHLRGRGATGRARAAAARPVPARVSRDDLA